jgi:diguanylate cyclase (GGDEF)-like protein
MTTSDSSPARASASLVRAWACAETGDSSGALDAATSVFEFADATSDARLRAEALLCQASCELRLLGRFERALELAQRAGASYRQAADVRGECAALATQAIATSRLGVYEAAVDCAMLAIRVTQSLAACRERVMAYEALGVAMFLGACYVEASSAFHQALDLARECEPPLSALELHTNLASAEAHRYALERVDGGRRLSLATIRYHLERCDALELEEREGAGQGVAAAGRINNAFILAFTRANFLTWQRRTADARAAIDALQQLLARHDRPWMAGALCWVRAEMHLCEGRNDEALACALEMEAVATRYRHDSMLGASIQLQRHIYDVTGDVAGTVIALRKLVDRSQRSRSNSLKGRVAFIDREIELRGKTSDILRLESDSRLFERMAFEDPLTGLPNRRKFEQTVNGWLESGCAGPLCLVMIDVNRFKRINDDFSHNAGDDVLRGIGKILRLHTRENDLAARLAGDEFALVLRNVTYEATAILCQRIRDAVRESDWEAVAAGLAVSISVGLTVAQPDDTLVKLLARSDRSMYADKRACSHH